MKDGEVVWVHGFWSQATAMNQDSFYTYLRRLLPRMAEERPNWLFVVSWPMRAHGVNWTYINDGLFDHPRIMRVGWPYDSQMRTGVLAFDPRRLDYIDSRFGPTIYWLHQIESGSQVYGGYRQSFNTTARPVIVGAHHYIIHPSLPYSFDGLFPRLWAQMGGTIAADAVVLNSQHTARMMSESFSEFLAPEQMKAIGDKSVVLPHSLYDVRFDVAIEQRRALGDMPDVPVVVYNHRFESYKQPDVTGEVLTALRASGRRFEVWATQITDQRIKAFPVDRAVGHPMQDVYLRNIAVPGINTINSMHETFCISAFESVALGQLLVAPNSVTFPELVPPGYPYLFDSVGQQTQMLRDIIDEWPKAYDEWSPKLRAFAADKFDFDRYVKSYATLMDSLDVVWNKSETKPDVERAVTRAIRSFKTGVHPLSVVTRAVQKATGSAEQAFPPRRIVREAVRRGMTLVPISDAEGEGVGLRAL